jgi:hypothetical protein
VTLPLNTPLSLRVPLSPTPFRSPPSHRLHPHAYTDPAFPSSKRLFELQPHERCVFHLRIEPRDMCLVQLANALPSGLENRVYGYVDIKVRRETEG